MLRYERGALSSLSDALAVEEPLEIRVSFCRQGIRVSRPVSVTMRTPGADAELAVGFLLTEGVIADGGGIAGVDQAEGKGGSRRVEVRLSDHVEPDVRPLERNFNVSSSCGVCGKASIDAVVSRAPDLDPERPALVLATLVQLPERLRAAQPTFDETGGLHAAGLFTAEGELTAAFEDVGRHNAVDKVVGHELLRVRAVPADRILVLSGRAGFELVQKALMAGIAAVVSVGAPSTLAVELARRHGQTLVGFVRGGRANVYSGAQRLKDVRTQEGMAP